MEKKISTALISVFYKDGLEPLLHQLHQLGVTIYSTGGTQKFITSLGIPVIAVETLTGYPSILGGRVKTLHPSVFGGILGKRDDATHVQEMQQYQIPTLDLVIVDLYPFEETVAATADEKAIIEKIDIGGPSMIRAAAKNFSDVTVVAAKKEYEPLRQLLADQQGMITLAQRKQLAAHAFAIVAQYDAAIAQYFDPQGSTGFVKAIGTSRSLRYGENPHQAALFYGRTEDLFTQLHGKELSYNNLLDIEAALQLIGEFEETCFAIIKHNNVCGVALRPTVFEAWQSALAGDPESAFGGVLVCNRTIDKETAASIQDIFFEVLMAPSFSEEALQLLQTKKNRILLQLVSTKPNQRQFRSALGGVLVQDSDNGNVSEWNQVSGPTCSEATKADLLFANLIAKHLKSNAIALVKNKQLVGKGCGQTSRIDSLRQALEKARQFKFELRGAVMASDAFFPFGDCVEMGHQAGIDAFIQPGGSIRDQDSIDYCKQHQLTLIITGQRHFKH
ncbi:MAG: bifunctional phosphoribosylaminoimidazolecarboxamide formyltransferase/IMP cyclohydrolase [Sphingomonadales bacterium]